jgi:hypothetical protein
VIKVRKISEIFAGDRVRSRMREFESSQSSQQNQRFEDRAFGRGLRLEAARIPDW